MPSPNENKLNGNQWPVLLALLIILVIFFLPGGVVFGSLHVSKQMISWVNLHSIALADQNFTIGGPVPRAFTVKPGDTAHMAALTLARAGLKEASFWVLKNDPAMAGQSIPQSVVIGEAPLETLNPEFAKLTLAYEFAVNIPPNAPQNTTPIAWTRGLQADGTWDKDSPWQGVGGHVAFLDGRVFWYDKNLPAEKVGDLTPLVKYGTNTITLNIREALPPGAVILSATPQK